MAQHASYNIASVWDYDVKQITDLTTTIGALYDSGVNSGLNQKLELLAGKAPTNATGRLAAGTWSFDIIAKKDGVAGNNIQVEIVEDADQVGYSTTVAGDVITITIPTDGLAVSSIFQAINAGGATNLIDSRYNSGGDQTQVVRAMSVQLEGGVDSPNMNDVPLIVVNGTINAPEIHVRARDGLWFRNEDYGEYLLIYG